jgi:LysM repeat protein
MLEVSVEVEGERGLSISRLGFSRRRVILFQGEDTMKQASWIGMMMVVLAFVGTGCARITTQVAEKPRVDQEIRGNRGYLMGSPPAVPERKKTRKIVQTDIELATLEELNPWKKPAQPTEPTPQAPAAPLPPLAIPIEPEPRRPHSEISPRIPIPPSVVEEEPLKPIAPAHMPPKKKPSGQTYIVQKGDTLEKISSKFYGTPRKWRRIYEANRDVLKNPNRLYPGQKLTIPQPDAEGSASPGPTDRQRFK